MPTSKKHYRVTLDQVLRAHNRALLFGGRSGIRDLGLIESAIARPYCGYYRPIAGKAAALVHSLALNHGFIDGNKRTAFAATYTFLAINGARLTAGAPETIEFVIALYGDNHFSFDRLVPWLREHVSA